MRKVVGLDISLQKTAVCVLDRDGALIWQGKVDSEPGPLIDKLQLWRDQIDVVGPLSEWLHRHLVAAGFKAVCVETLHAQRFLSTRPVKTDRNDARGIAEMMRVGHYRPVHVKSAEAQLIRNTLQARRQIVATLLQIQGSIRGLLRMHGLKVGEIHRNRFDKRVGELLEEMPLLKVAIEPLLRVLGQLVAERKALDNRLGQAARKNAACLRLMTIPGVGPITSLAFRVTVDDPAAHVGLTPRVHQSGETDRSGKISKAGDHMLRHLLYEAASALMTRCRQPSKLRAWGIAIARRRGAKRARVAVARKLAVIMHRMWVAGSRFEAGAGLGKLTAS
ncbi:MAG TPA: IS110 family transposase [Acetobacteraceae bacterium]